MKKLKKKNHVSKRSYFRHAMPVMVWLTSVTIVIWLFYHRTQQFQVLGIAQSQERQVGVSCAGRLTDVSVQLFDEVTKGQVIAIVDTVLDNELDEAPLRAQLGRISAEIEHLTAQLVPTQNDLMVNQTDRETDRMSDLRRFMVDVESARLRIIELKLQGAADQIELENLEAEVTIAQELVDKGAIAPFELKKAKGQYQVLAEAISENKHMLEQAETNLQQAQQRLDDYAGHQTQRLSIESHLDVIRKGIGVQEQMMQEVLAQLEALAQRRKVKLIAPVDGVVRQIWHGVGEVVTAGEPVIIVVETKPTEVIAYADQTQAGQLKDNMNIQVIKTTIPMQVAQSRVTYVGPAIEQIPARLWRNPTVPQWGRPFKIEFPPGLAVVPGEVVGIRGF